MVATRIVRRTAWSFLLVIALAAASSDRPRLVQAQGGQCTQTCHASYAECYKNTGSNRKVCEAQLQQCLANCINKR